MKTRILASILIVGGLFVIAYRSYGCGGPPPNQDPEAILTAIPQYVAPGRTVILDGSGSFDSDGSIVKYEWDWTNDDSYDYNETSGSHPDGKFDGITTHVYSSADTYTARLRVTDNDSATTTDTYTVYVGRVFNVTDGLSYDSIQGAIDEASANDVIKVYPGRYIENINFTSAEITLTSIDANNPEVVARTIVDGNSDGRVMTFGSGDADSIITGLTITNGHVEGTEDAGRGGGISCSGGASPKISNCVIAGNYAFLDGGGIYCKNVSPEISNCVFVNNNGRVNGGGMYCDNSSSSTYPTITNCVFSGNISTNNGAGLGMFNYASSPTIVNCIFSGNIDTSGSYGGGMANRGSDETHKSSPILINCVFSGNRVGNDGGGMYNHDYTNPTITNCIFWGNSDEGGMDESAQIHGGTPVVNYSCVQGGWSGQGDDNIDADPCFADESDLAGPDDIYGTRDDGLFLRTVSDCIDEGTNGAVSESTDITGNNRIANGDHKDNNAAIVDMGAYELPVVWYVDVDAGSGGDGKSWGSGNAYDDLQDALTNTDVNDGNEIWVADGTYEPDASDRSVSFELIEGVAVYGGFVGNEVSLNGRDWLNNETILSGDIGVEGDANDNSYHVVEGTDGAILDGFTITGGDANSSGADSHGAGIYCYGSSPIISNCKITDNSASYYGGGMYCANSASPAVIGCVFSENEADYGGGVSSYNSSPAIINCAIVDNSGNINGGGMYNEGGSPELTNCVFSGNSTTVFGNGGGIYNDNSCPTLTNCTFSGNNTDGQGGGMRNYDDSSPVVTNCIFWDNEAGAGDEIYNSDSEPFFGYCYIKGSGGSGNWNTDFGIDAGGNIDNDPCFADAGDPDGPDDVFRTCDDGLQLDDSDDPDITEGHDVKSTCIDAGINPASPGCITQTAVTGRRRIINGTVDIGAYESAGYEFYENCGACYPIYESTPKYVKVVINGMQLCEFPPYHSWPWYVQSPHELIIKQVTTGIYCPGDLCDGTPCEWVHGSPFTEDLHIVTYYKCCGDDEKSRLRLWESAIASEVYNYFDSDSTCSQTYFENESLCYIEFAAYDGTAKVTWGPEINGKAYLDQLLASNPSPEDGATDVSINADLGWTAGYVIKSHDVYFGTDYSEVYGATDPNTAPGRGRQTDTTFDPGTMDYNTAYYWRIDEVDPQENTRTGYVWSFTTVAE